MRLFSSHFKDCTVVYLGAVSPGGRMGGTELEDLS